VNEPTLLIGEAHIELARHERADSGFCDDCRIQNERRWLIGKVTVCKHCALHRMRVRVNLDKLSQLGSRDA
jgi:hypothetical protein